MIKESFYDFVIIGGGISSSVFVSSHIKNGFDGKFAIIENGRNLGGRSTTRFSKSYDGWRFNHGSPNFNICNTNKNGILQIFIQELLDAQIIEHDCSDLIELYSDPKLETKLNSDFYSGTNYISCTSMSELSKKIISLNNLNNQVDYFFKTLIVKLEFKNNRWILSSKNGNKFYTKFLVSSSNLILHKRSLDILKINQTPLRNAIPKNKDQKLDKIINFVNHQGYIQRLTFLIYTNDNYSYKDNYKKRYRYFILSNTLEEKFKFERIIFQKQENDKLGIVIHTRNKEFIMECLKHKNIEIFKKELVKKFNHLFEKNILINKIEDYKDISIMRWRASQPCGIAVPENLQICENHNIAFCGDWFDFEGFGRVEGAILSALKLSHKINSLF